MAAAKKPRMREMYEQDVTKGLQDKFEYKSSMQVPKPVKVVINMGLGNAPNNPKLARERRGRAGDHHRSEGCQDQGAQVGLELQDP